MQSHGCDLKIIVTEVNAPSKLSEFLPSMYTFIDTKITNVKTLFSSISNKIRAITSSTKKTDIEKNKKNELIVSEIQKCMPIAHYPVDSTGCAQCLCDGTCRHDVKLCSFR